MELDLTNLRNHLILSKSKLDTWVEHEKARVDAQTMRSIHAMESYQKRLDDQVAQLRALRVVDKNNDSNGQTEGLDKNATTSKQEEDLIDERKAVELEVEQLTKRQEEQETRINELKEERHRQDLRNQQVQKQQAEAQRDREMKIEDLTRGIVNYQYLGMDFEKAQENHMKFVFKLLDPEDPDRRFSFLLLVDDDEDQYRVEECEPPLPPLRIQELENDLNDTDNMMTFCMNAREAFRSLM